MSDSLIQLPEMARGASFAGTCLMHTMMFTGIFLFRAIFAWTQVPDHAEVEILRSAQDDKRRLARHFSDQRRKMSAALVPPKPKEFESAYSTEALRACFGT